MKARTAFLLLLTGFALASAATLHARAEDNAPARASQPAPETQTQPASDASAQPAPEAQTQRAPEAQTQPARDASAQPAPEAKAQRAPEAQARPASDASAQPVPEAQVPRAPKVYAQELPAVARPRYQLGAQVLSPGTAFFLSIPASPFAVAVTTARHFELSELAAAGELSFELAHSAVRAGTSNTLYLPPGVRAGAAGGSLRDDYLVFALDFPLQNARALAPESAPPETLLGARVKILGIPNAMLRDEDDIYGELIAASEDKLEVRLDVLLDWRGWGGAPLLLHPQGTVLGLLGGVRPDENNATLVIDAVPIGGLVESLRRPAGDGLGIPFSRFAAGETDAAALAREKLAREKSAPAQGAASAGAAPGARTPETPGLLARAGPAPENAPLLGRGGVLSTALTLEIEYPPPGAYIGDTEGALVAGRALAELGGVRRFDVMLVLDTSGSTAESTGLDLNGNGIIGEARFGGLFHTDRDDSVLAAELVAAQRVLTSLDARNTRVGVVTFAGARPPSLDDDFIVVRPLRPDARTEQPLDADYEAVQRALARIRKRGSSGLTNMTEGIRLAVRELRGFQDARSTLDPESEKIVMLFTDGTPTLPYHGSSGANLRSVVRAAEQARSADVRVHSFAIGPAALRGPAATVEMARITGGRFTPVRDPGDLGEIVENVNFANIQELTVRNATLDAPAYELITAADGSFAALAPLATGKNLLEVRVLAANGSTTVETVEVQHAPGVASPQLSRALLAKRNRLLERRLLSLKRGQMEAERAEQKRRLQVEIARERADAESSAEEQLRTLRIEVDETN